jgi:DNA repair protein RadA/Sms
MVKTKTEYVCRSCGARSVRWSGRCGTCGEWDGLEQTTSTPAAVDVPSRLPPAELPRPIPLTEIRADDRPRVDTGLGEIDRVLGGGLVPGSAILLGGPPGIGKSTLLLQVCGQLARAGRRALYVTGEESVLQVGLRAGRLDLRSPDLLLLTETDLRRILTCAEETAPDVLVLDSIQMIHEPGMPAAPGSVSQVRECAAALVLHAKRSGTPVILVGHVTKDGAIAGPKLLEHMVDTVLSLEGDGTHGCRLLRGTKNRFGPTDEIGLFEMGEAGLREVEDPSSLFLTGEREEAPGSTVFPSLEGSRVLLVEVQALVADSGGGSPARRVTGFDGNRLALILAVLERQAGLAFARFDVFVNVVGGVRLVEPAADLAVALALASAKAGRPFPRDAVALGEIGLQGEIRAVPRAAARLAEARRLGFPAAVLPRNGERARRSRVRRVRRISEAVEFLTASG